MKQNIKISIQNYYLYIMYCVSSTIFLNNCLAIFILKCLSPNKKIYTCININWLAEKKIRNLIIYKLQNVHYLQ